MAQWSITSGRLSPAQVARVLDLAEAAAAADSVAPLSEHVRLHLRYDAAGPGADPAPGRDLVLTVNDEIAGYAYLDSPGHPDLEVSGELVIHPLHRGRGLVGGGAATGPVASHSAGAWSVSPPTACPIVSATYRAIGRVRV